MVAAMVRRPPVVEDLKAVLGPLRLGAVPFLSPCALAGGVVVGSWPETFRLVSAETMAEEDLEASGEGSVVFEGKRPHDKIVRGG